MPDAYEILGITKTTSIEDIKKAYRTKVKELHPDIGRNRDQSEAHEKMIEIVHAYETVLRGSGDTTTFDDSIPARASRDREYEYYKKGIGIFRNVHPSKWKRVTLKTLFEYSDEWEEGTAEIVAALVGNLNEAKYYFSVVVRDYPTGRWSSDSEEKIRQIDKMMIRYQKIIQSYRNGHTT